MTEETRISLRQKIPLRLRKILKNSLGSFLKVLVVGGFLSVLVIYALDTNDGFAPQVMKDHAEKILSIWFLFLILFMFWRMIYEYLHYRTYAYEMDDSNIVIRKGVVARREITIPFSRVTDVYVTQDLFDVMLGLYDVNISTPTQESGIFAHINGVNKRGAHRLKQMILDRIKENQIAA